MALSAKDFPKLITTFKTKAEELGQLDYDASQAIIDLHDAEDIAHKEIKIRFKEICEADYYRYNNAPVQVGNFPPQLDLAHFQQKLNETKASKLENKNYENQIKQQVDEKKKQIAEMEESLRKKLEIIKSAKKSFL